ncbi:hypothetical protein K1T71_005844 [Dendrolimus kikuchii]|uniref:Uncharacterized protein n=1 Tax=Dendrolimus kikuchii TaxID=765133 RepID=A0ACC1D573_9NEOP|nr:hypothetical protein K1T71_005844 [Dendrolimus kikuchii]
MNSLKIMAMAQEENAPKKSRRKRKRQVVETLSSYAKNTSLHGVKYIVDRTMTRIEKVFWLMAIIASVTMCVFLMHNSWHKWRTNPIVITINERATPIEDVYFPSVTICPQIKCKATVYNYTLEKQKYDNLTWILVLTEDMKEFNPKWQSSKIYFKPTTFVKNILDVAPDYDDVFIRCFWQSIEKNCTSLFRKVLTREGVCYTMNSYKTDDIFREKNMHNEYLYLPDSSWETLNHDNYMLRADWNGEVSDLSILLMLNMKDKDKHCHQSFDGFKVYLHEQADMPQSGLYYYAIHPGQATNLALSFETTHTPDELKAYAPEARQCYFPGERYLRFFRAYTANNCRMECFTNVTLEECGCASQFMPHDNNTRLYETTTTADNISSYEDDNDDFDVISAREEDPCNCLPTCNQVKYKADRFKLPFDIKDHQIELYYSRLDLFFKHDSFMSMRRSELFGQTDFIAQCGGLLGLFLGFSVFSLVECVYFLIIRLSCRLIKPQD